MIGHRGSRSRDDARRIDSAFRRDRLLQRRIAVSAVAVDFELVGRDAKLAKWKRTDATGGKVVAGLALQLGPVHVVGRAIFHEVEGVVFARCRQNKYTGIPASKITTPNAVLLG